LDLIVNVHVSLGEREKVLLKLLHNFEHGHFVDVAEGIKPLNVSPDVLKHALPVSHVVEFIHLVNSLLLSCPFLLVHPILPHFDKGSSLQESVTYNSGIVISSEDGGASYLSCDHRLVNLILSSV